VVGISPPEFGRGSNPMKSVYGMHVHPDGCVHVLGMKVAAQKLLMVPAGDASKTVYALTSLVMGKDDMTKYSVTGRQANAFKSLPAKPEIPMNTKAVIIFIAQHIHPGLSLKEIEKAIGRKLNMACKVSKGAKPEASNAASVEGAGNSGI